MIIHKCLTCLLLRPQHSPSQMTWGPSFFWFLSSLFYPNEALEIFIPYHILVHVQLILNLSQLHQFLFHIFTYHLFSPLCNCCIKHVVGTDFAILELCDYWSMWGFVKFYLSALMTSYLWLTHNTILGKSTILLSVWFQVPKTLVECFGGLKYFRWWWFIMILIYALKFYIKNMPGELTEGNLSESTI